jgi:methylase of polypeptide subunit release factors
MHPSVLTTTTLGNFNDGAVMYIGPDSLALVQHFPIELYINRKESGENCRTSLQILDFCTGSGVQALSILKALEISHPNSMATCVDLNDRALRFTNFNAVLNGISIDRIKCIKADLLSGKILESRYARSGEEGRMLLNDILAKNGYDIVTANPPFIPVPCPTDQIRIDRTINDISKRYGLFSSGGSLGEEVLQKIIQWAPLLLREKHGLLAVVSEFMNPPHENNGDKALIEKIIYWWHSVANFDKTVSINGVGILLTNQFPVSDEVYASRRADNEAERIIWINHLKDSHIRSISPGLLYIQTGLNEGSQNLCMEFKLVPQSSILGSIWTPYNFKAVEFTKSQWRELISKWDKVKTI